MAYDYLGNYHNPNEKVFPSVTIGDSGENDTALVKEAYAAIDAADLASAKKLVPDEHPGEMWYMAKENIWFVAKRGYFPYSELTPNEKAFADWVKRKGLLMGYSIY